jgi:hypothetical protein
MKTNLIALVACTVLAANCMAEPFNGLTADMTSL